MFLSVENKSVFIHWQSFIDNHSFAIIRMNRPELNLDLNADQRTFGKIWTFFFQKELKKKLLFVPSTKFFFLHLTSLENVNVIYDEAS